METIIITSTDTLTVEQADGGCITVTLENDGKAAGTLVLTTAGLSKLLNALSPF